MTEPEAFCAYLAAAAKRLPLTGVGEITQAEWDAARDAAKRMVAIHRAEYPFADPVPGEVDEVVKLLEEWTALLTGPQWPDTRDAILGRTAGDLKRWRDRLRAWRAGA